MAEIVQTNQAQPWYSILGGIIENTYGVVQSIRDRAAAKESENASLNLQSSIPVVAGIDTRYIIWAAVGLVVLIIVVALLRR